MEVEGDEDGDVSSEKHECRKKDHKENNYEGKVQMIRSLLDELKRKKKAHYQAFAVYRNMRTAAKTLINSLNAVSVCSMILAFTPTSQPVMIVALGATSISSIASAMVDAVDVEGKVHSHNTTYLQQTDLFRDVSARLLRNGMSSSDLDLLLTEVNSRMGLIEDHSLPVST